MNRTSIQYLASASLVVLGLCAATAAQAQGAGSTAPPTPTAIDEVVVTAQRQSEKLQDVPLAVTAVSGQQLEAANLIRVNDIDMFTPGMVFIVSDGFAQPYLRGVGTANPIIGVEGAIASYVDGTYITRAQAGLTDLVDMAGVQILQGPQGTLWGRNASGGAILYTTADPVIGENSAQLSGEAGNRHHGLIGGVANLAMGDTMALRLAAQSVHDGGYVTNPLNGRKYNGRDTTTIRGKLKWTPTDRFSATLLVEGYNSTDRNAVRSIRSPAPLCTSCGIVIPGLGAIGVPVTGFYETTPSETTKPYRTVFSSQSLNMVYEGDNFTISSATSHREGNTFQIIDIGGGSRVPFLNYSSNGGGNTWGQELSVSTQFEGMLNYTVGGSYYDDHGIFDPELSGAALQPVFAATGEFPRATQDVTTKTYSAFAEVYLTPIEHLKITVGGRYTHDHRDFDGTITFAGALGFAQNPAAPLAFSNSASFEKFTPRVVVAYDFDQVNVYASYGEGYKAGGFQVPSFTKPGVIKSEVVKNYEAGAKFVSEDRRLRLNLAAYRYKYNNIQVQINDTVTGPRLENAASATGRGASLDGSYVVTDWLNLFGNLSYLRAKYGSYPGASVIIATPTGLVVVTRDLSGVRLPRAPKWTAAGGFNIETTVFSNKQAYLNVVGHYTSDYDFQPGGGPDGLPVGSPFIDFEVQKSYTVVNITGGIKYEMGGSGFGPQTVDLGFYVNNATKEKYYTSRSALTGAGGLFDTVAAPISYGVRAVVGF